MRTIIRTAVDGLAALTFMAACAAANADIIDNHVVVTAPYYGSVPSGTGGYDAAYALQLGTGSWPFPYVDVQVDNADGRSSYAKLSSSASYLTYLHDVALFPVTPGAEISNKTISDGSFPSFFFSVSSFATSPVWPSQEIVSLDGSSPDIYLGFSIKAAQAPSDTASFGWVHLNYTQQSGLTMVSSAMTTTEAGIYALSRTTISAVDEQGTQVLALMGVAGLVASQLRRRRHSA